MDFFSAVKGVFWSMLDPWTFMGMSSSYLPGALLQLARNDGLAALFSWPRVQTAWFRDFWSFVGREIRKGNNDNITALLQGRVSQGAIVNEPQTQPLSGVVLEIGPGVGFWVDIFSAFNVAADEKPTRSRTSRQPGKLKIYGVEPSTSAHPQLKEHIEAAGLEGVYEILPVGIQSILADPNNKIGAETVDCIVSVLCLCSIPEPEKNIQALYKLLKPGGRWYVYEHVQLKRSVFLKWYQAFCGLFWPYFIGGCQLCRDTEKSLRNAGQWSVIDLATPVEEPWHQLVPHVFGTLTK